MLVLVRGDTCGGVLHGVGKVRPGASSDDEGLLGRVRRKRKNRERGDKYSNMHEEDGERRDRRVADLIRFSGCRSPCYSITVYYIA